MNQFQIGDIVVHNFTDEHYYLILGFNKRDPDLPDWCKNMVQIMHLFSKHDSSFLPKVGEVRFVSPRIFEREYSKAT